MVRFKLDPRVNLEDIVQQLPSNLTGADLSSLASNAMLNCFSRKILLIKEGRNKNKISFFLNGPVI